MLSAKPYTIGTYENQSYLLPSYMKNLRTVFKNETYSSHELNTIEFFRLENEEAIIPRTAIAALSVWFTYGHEPPNRSILRRYCFLDAEGYRIPDHSTRQFNWRVDEWLDYVRVSRRNFYAWFADAYD